MSQSIYTDEEKRAFVEEYKASGMSASGYAREKGIADTTFAGWIKADRKLNFGAIEVNANVPVLPRTIKPATIFATENMRIELKEGFDKELLKSIVGVLLDD